MRIAAVLLLLSSFLSGWTQELSKNEFNLIQAAEKGKSEEVLTLLQKGIDPNCAGWDGMTPLHYATQNGHLKVVKILLLNGASVNPMDMDNRSPLLLAVHFNQLDIAEFLMQKGADPNLADSEGLTPLFYAAAYGDYLMTDMFLFYGGKQKIKDYDGKNPFLVAVWGGYPAVARLLLNYGADVQSADGEKRNALMLAIANRDTIMVDSLLAWGVQPDHTDRHKHSALEYAVKVKDYQLVRMMLNAGADPNHEIQKGFNSLDYARAIGAGDQIIQLLQDAGAEELKGLYFKYLNLSLQSRFNAVDAKLGLALEWFDIKNNAGLYAGLFQRPGRIKLYYPVNDSTDFLYRETRTYLMAGFEKLFPMVRLPNGSQWGFGTALDGSLSLGDFKASGTRPPVGYSLNPQVSLYFAKPLIRYQVGYLYQWSNLTQIPGGFITVGMNVSLSRRPFL